MDIAYSAKLLGAGRDKKSDSIDFGAGIRLNKKIGDSIQKGEPVMTLFYNNVDENRVNDSKNYAYKSFKISQNKVESKLIY